MKSLFAKKFPVSGSTSMGNWANLRVAGPKIGFAYCSASNCDWWHGHRMRFVRLSYSEVGHPRWLQIFV
jgi:hypothetical protein